MRYSVDEIFLMIELALGNPPEPVPAGSNVAATKEGRRRDSEYYDQLNAFITALKPGIDLEELSYIRTNFYMRHHIWHFAAI